MLLINNIGRHIEGLRPEIDNAIEGVLTRGWVVLGSEVESFEQDFAQYVGVPHCVGVANGTDALELGLRALGVAAGDRVATVANAGFYATTAILAIQAKPVFMDVDPKTYLVTLPEIYRAIAAGVKAVVVTHLYGRAHPDIEEIVRACQESGVVLVEDCAQAHGAVVKGQRVGSFGEVGCFSFYPTKNLGAIGDGGAVVTANESVGKKLRQLRQYGWNGKYRVESLGGRNSRLDELQAAVLRVSLPHLDFWNHRRRSIAACYTSQIVHPLVYLPDAPSKEHVMHLYVIQTERRSSLSEYLHQNGVACDVHYPVPDHLQVGLRGEFANCSLGVTELLANRVLSLPCYPEMTEEDIAHVIKLVNEWHP